MTVKVRRGGIPGARGQRGFSMIEVLIAVLVIGLGLLGLAMLQTLNVRYAQSANYRTRATNLAYDLLDQIRANRALAQQFQGIDKASFAAETGKLCSRPVTTQNGVITTAQSAARWRCQVRAALGPAAYAAVTRNGNAYSVEVGWSDLQGEAGKQDGYSNGKINVTTEL
ncbi:type IV pilus modification protein PilV [Lysobacter enzymogenes]|uniref:Type IV pilus assembly protein PilV n=2 Tax=Bacteria TaxID=2 RepID=A0AAU9AD78_LYSEN|nr:type IV pilus modification protein PilV [Lysobacter enzymogenes]BAV96990.1 type IV pilus assembly protein PilV [Lysobacter enzymogenes]